MLKRIVEVFVAVLFIGFGIWSYNYNRSKETELQKNGILLNCKVTDATLFDKGSDFTFEFYYGGVKREGRSKSATGSSTYFIGQNFPLMYSPESNSMQILIAPGDFNMFSIAFPDSLNWVLRR